MSDLKRIIITITQELCDEMNAIIASEKQHTNRSEYIRAAIALMNSKGITKRRRK